MLNAARAALAGLALLGVGCGEATKPAELATVSIEGCPVVGVEAGCVMLQAADGQLYNLTSADPKPPLDGRAIRLTALPRPGMDICMQGIGLAQVRWTYTGANCGR